MKWNFALCEQKIFRKICLIVLFSTLSMVQSLAHDFWVDGYNSLVFKAHIGYGHMFPEPEKIAEDRVKIFEPIVLIDKNLKSTILKNVGENYEYSGQKALDTGSYILKSTYKPTYWTKAPDDNWHMDKTKKDIKNAQRCVQASRFAKSIINIGDNTDNFVTKPIGQNLEIVPLDNPSNFKVGVPFKLKVLLDGKPAKTIEVKGTFDGFIKEHFAFYGRTNLKGEIEILPLKAGKWILLTKATKTYENETCDEISYAATLTFQIK